MHSFASFNFLIKRYAECWCDPLVKTSRAYSISIRCSADFYVQIAAHIDTCLQPPFPDPSTHREHLFALRNLHRRVVKTWYWSYRCRELWALL